MRQVVVKRVEARGNVVAGGEVQADRADGIGTGENGHVDANVATTRRPRLEGGHVSVNVESARRPSLERGHVSVNVATAKRPTIPS